MLSWSFDWHQLLQCRSLSWNLDFFEDFHGLEVFCDHFALGIGNLDPRWGYCHLRQYLELRQLFAVWRWGKAYFSDRFGWGELTGGAYFFRIWGATGTLLRGLAAWWWCWASTCSFCSPRFPIASWSVSWWPATPALSWSRTASSSLAFWLFFQSCVLSVPSIWFPLPQFSFSQLSP